MVLLAQMLCLCLAHIAGAQNYEPAASTPGAPGFCWYMRMTPALNNALRGITYGNGLWVAVGDSGALLRSADGETWTEAAHCSGDNMKAVAWTGVRFVAVGRSGGSFVSSDGIAWTRNSTSAGVDLNAILWTGNNLIAVGNSGATVISSDGLTWTHATSKPPTTFSSNCIATNGTRLVSGGNGIYYSDDGGMSWSPASTAPTSVVMGLAWDGARWAAAGSKDGAWWLTSPTASDWSETKYDMGTRNLSFLVAESSSRARTADCFPDPP